MIIYGGEGFDRQCLEDRNGSQLQLINMENQSQSKITRLWCSHEL